MRAKLGGKRGKSALKWRKRTSKRWGLTPNVGKSILKMRNLHCKIKIKPKKREMNPKNPLETSLKMWEWRPKSRK